MKILLVSAIILISGCCTPDIITQPAHVTVLPLPELEVLTHAEQSAIELETYKKLVKRDIQWREFVKTQQKLIELNNSGREL